jgi:hypothetical protein
MVSRKTALSSFESTGECLGGYHAACQMTRRADEPSHLVGSHVGPVLRVRRRSQQECSCRIGHRGYPGGSRQRFDFGAARHDIALLKQIAWTLTLAIALIATVFLVAARAGGGIKGGSVSTQAVVSCLAVSAAVASILARRRKWIIAPFVAGIAGVFATGNEFAGPYGGVLGLSVGTAVTLIAWGRLQRGASKASDLMENQGSSER